MEIDTEGHLIVTPQEVSNILCNSQKLINTVLIPGTPLAFSTYNNYCNFLDACSDTLGVHPRNILVRGSAKLGFSMKPNKDSIWREFHLGSDIDLAIIDPNYYHYLDREIRMYERNPENNAFSGKQYHKSIQRKKHRSFYTYQFNTLPDIPPVVEHNRRIKSLPVENCCGSPRPINAFVFRDWWSLYTRWASDIRAIIKKIKEGELPSGDDTPRPYEETL